MATIGGSLKGALMRSMELLGNAADRLATSTRFKVSEMNLSNQRKEILDGLGQKVYQLWQAGVAFPEEICQQLQQVAVLDQQLEEIRAQYQSEQEAAAQKTAKAATAAAEPQVPVEMPAEEAPAEEQAPEAEEPAEEIPPEKIPVPEEIPAPEENPAPEEPTVPEQPV